MSEAASKEQLREQIVRLVAQYGALASQPAPFQPGVTVIPPAGKVVGAPEMELMVEASLDAWLTLAASTNSSSGSWPSLSACST